MIRAILFAFFMTCVFIIPLPAQDSEAGREKIVIYHFKDISKSARFGYYSYIIPRSIESEIKYFDKEKRYDIQTIPVTLDYVDGSAQENVLGTHIRMLADRGKEFSATYILTGSYFVVENEITIKLQVFDVRGQNLSDIEETTTELGAIILDVIENVTKKINVELAGANEKKSEELRLKEEELARQQEELRKEEEERRQEELEKEQEEQERIEEERALELESMAVSPFIPLYSLIKGATLGIYYGTAKIRGDWEKLYRDAKYMSAYLYYDFNNIEFLSEDPVLSNLSISINVDLFSALPDASNYSGRSYLSMQGVTINPGYFYRLSDFVNAGVAAGLGFVSTKIDREDGGPEGESRETFDPCYGISLLANFTFSAVNLSAGATFKRISYADKPLDYIAYFAGIGLRI